MSARSFSWSRAWCAERTGASAAESSGGRERGARFQPRAGRSSPSPPHRVVEHGVRAGSIWRHLFFICLHSAHSLKRRDSRLCWRETSSRRRNTECRSVADFLPFVGAAAAERRSHVLAACQPLAKTRLITPLSNKAPYHGPFSQSWFMLTPVVFASVNTH